MKTPGWLLPATALLLALFGSMPARAFELSGGVSLGGFQVGGLLPRLAVTPHVGLSWRRESGFLFGAHDLFSILTPVNKAGLGVFNKTAITIGYGWEEGHFNAGPSLSIYSMPACGVTFLCGRVAGVAPGGHAQADVYFAGPLGVSVSANVDWIGGRSLVLPGGVAAMIVAGPVLRWRSR
ncbi:MAG TPA: hypothetical protein VEX38_09690 [Fimbriimonadaceae bacterium]|nr:hypothetical protein [Fimbriimonadaceae bacterium]